MMNPEMTKSKIINAAGELAAELGLDHVSTRAVARRSGENLGSIHYHFGGKDGLFEAVVLEAICDRLDALYVKDILELAEGAASPARLSVVLRRIVSATITELFRTDRPAWHTQVIYQLLQRDDALYELFRENVLKPHTKAITEFFLLFDANMGHDEIHLRSTLLRMPIFAHATYMKRMLEQLGAATFAEEYLQKMEDLLVKQTQLLMGLPCDQQE